MGTLIHMHKEKYSYWIVQAEVRCFFGECVYYVTISCRCSLQNMALHRFIGQATRVQIWLLETSDIFAKYYITHVNQPFYEIWFPANLEIFLEKYYINHVYLSLYINPDLAHWNFWHFYKILHHAGLSTTP